MRRLPKHLPLPPDPGSRDAVDRAVAEEQAADLLRVTGEDGGTIPDLLGLPRSAERGELEAAARTRLRRWSLLAEDPTFSGPTRRAGQVVRRAYDRVLSHIATL